MKVAAIAGGVGGAKMADGLARVLPAQHLTIIVNIADDFEHFGLHISPDLDTVCYTLAGLANPETGWGRSDESWQALIELERLGAPAWFRLGDRDLATHLERTRRRRAGHKLSQVTADFCRSWGIPVAVLPASDDPVRTIVHTNLGALAFQSYFVEHGCRPRVTGFTFEGIERAGAAPGVLQALRQADLVVICPSNPWVSVDPILGIPGIREAVQGRPVVAISPIIGGQAVRGPAAKMYAELGIQPSAEAVARHYQELLAGFVIDHMDEKEAASIRRLRMPVLVTFTLMKSSKDRIRLARGVLAFCQEQFGI